MKAGRAARRSQRRLAEDVRPSRVRLELDLDPSLHPRFAGRVSMDLSLLRPRRTLRLHASGLRVSRARALAGERRLRGRVRALPELEMLEIELDGELPAGEATLELAFRGKLRSDLAGPYAVQVGERRYAFTQLEATEARTLFPCFDEPAMKARFRVSVTTGRHNTVLSNSPVERSVRADAGRKTVHFEETPPLSTYLLALAVGELESSKPSFVGPTEIRVWHTPGKRGLSSFALEAARECLARLERWFGVPYPYAKLDLVAVPDFEFGAMENAGAVFFRETLLLLDPRSSTLTERKRAAEVICHELAHMWYGDLVTMAWWDDLWLNESFATWMAFQIVDDWRPEWRMWHDFQHGRAAALELDALRHTHPVYCEVETPAEASENFDLITYEKGASVVRMLHRYLGPARFRRGVRAYIRRHREGNARARDLWRALSEASGEDVERVARAWIEKPGHPLLELRRRGRVLTLRQEPFREQPQPGRRAGTRWPIPWVGRVGRKGRSRTERRLLTRARQTWTLPAPAPDFVYANAEESGFFRPLHPDRELKALLGSLHALRPIERMGLVDHQWALVRGGRAPVGSVLDLADTLGEETDPDVLLALIKPLRFLGDCLAPDAAPERAPAYRSWLEARFGPAFEALGWRAARGEPDEARLRRAALLAIAGGVAGSKPLAAQARHHAERYLADRRTLDPNLSDAVVGLAARHGDAALHERFAREARSARTPQEQRRFLLALGDFRAPAQIRRSLAMSVGSQVPSQDVVFLLIRLLANPAAREEAWSFVQRRWPALSRRVPKLLASRLIDATPQLLTPARRREVARFFRENPVPSGERALRQALERFDWYRGFRRRAAAELGAWLDAR